MGSKRLQGGALIALMALLWSLGAGSVPESLAGQSPVTDLGGDDIVWVCNPAGVRDDGSFVDMALRRVRDSMGLEYPPLAGEFPETDVERMRVRGDGSAAINDLFYKRGWTDGLPVVVPTFERLKSMLTGTDLERAYEVATLAPMNGVATVEKIAVNAIMAGCRPVHMPILIAAVRAIADPDFDLRGMSTTTSPDVPCIIITGPIARQIGLNTGFNVMGRGNRGNASIGRALQLIINNIGGSWPGITDMSCLGSPAEHGMVIVENPDGNPWPSFNEDMGLPADANAVTVLGAEGWRVAVAHGWSGPDVMRLMGRHLAGLAYQRPRWPTILVVIPGDTAYQLAHEGYTKERIRKELREQNPIPKGEYEKWFANDFWKQGVTRTLAEHPGEPVIAAPETDHLLILYAGGNGMKNIIVPGWFGAKGPVTREVELPPDWDDVVAADKGAF
ncbi:hypothetical protein DND132_2342 [Pseudodesulfovibrio mercurii]|uniref:Thiol-disulfide oxidoreductase n=1 Tax=Pseudodesulfovibrio mercurii TaxID=641491 RepID=F0JBP3_9BACT|nr:hypothetical protein [Pseudodesulfovibrio mercurii]EGB15546.1 hypothetical protein DND132_2342 [Pseudodesulfovibrio mercurii]